MERTYTTPLLDKLGVRPGSRVALVGEVDPDGVFRRLLADRTTDVTAASSIRWPTVRARSGGGTIHAWVATSSSSWSSSS